MSNIIEIRNGVIVSNEQPADEYLPVGTHMDRPDGHYVSFGMDVEGPYDHAAAQERVKSLKSATSREISRDR